MQCKIDKMIMFHAIAKFVPNMSGGTALKKQLGLYVASRKKKFQGSTCSLEEMRFIMSIFAYPTSILELPGNFM